MAADSLVSIRMYGARVLLKHLKAIENELEGVITGGDIEYVHRCRVASRRMRAALGLFGNACFSKKDQKALYGNIRKVTRSLGDARDTDVQIVVLSDVLNSLSDPSLKPGIRRILLRVQQKRLKAQAKVIKVVEYLAEKDVIASTRDILTPMTTMVGEGAPAFDPMLYSLANEAITSRLDEMLAHEPFIHDPANLEQLHAMRIKAKALRYTLESFEEIYDSQLKGIIQTMRELQDALGALHDLDVWISWIPQFVIDERERVRAYFGNTGQLKRLLPGLQAFLVSRRVMREMAYEDFLKLWKRIERDEVWERLRGIVSSQA